MRHHEDLNDEDKRRFASYLNTTVEQLEQQRIINRWSSVLEQGNLSVEEQMKNLKTAIVIESKQREFDDKEIRKITNGN